MKLQITSELTGNEILDIFIQQLKQNNIDAQASDIKILIQSKDKVVELTPDRLSLSYTKTQV